VRALEQEQEQERVLVLVLVLVLAPAREREREREQERARPPARQGQGLVRVPGSAPGLAPERARVPVAAWAVVVAPSVPARARRAPV